MENLGIATSGNRGIDNSCHKIRFGIMCGKKTTFQTWQVDCIKKLLDLDFVELALLIIDDNVDCQSLFDRIKNVPLNRVFFILYYNFFVKSRAVVKDKPLDIPPKIDYIHCKIIQKGRFSQYFDKRDVEKIRAYKLDFILRFGFNIIRGEILGAARYGVWSFHHDDEEKYRGWPSSFWEIYKGDSVIGAILQRLTNRLDSGVILKKGFFPVFNFSYAKNVELIFSETAKWPAKLCIDIHNGVTGYFDNPPSNTKAPIYQPPNNRVMILFIIKLLKNNLLRLYKHLFCHMQWNIGIAPKPISAFLRQQDKPRVYWLPAPKKCTFLADPFGIRKNDRVTIFCEGFDYYREKGSIFCLNIDGNMAIHSTKEILNQKSHMSYPYLFEHQGEVYLVPETYQQREVSLYKAVNFPYEWLKVKTLIKGGAYVDATIFQYGSYWWLSCTDADQNPDLNLFIWYAPDLLGPWKAHAGNPVKTDITSTRPAGTPFIHNGLFYRPAQDCSCEYAGGIALNRILVLTPTEFKEELAAMINPYVDTLFPKGIHTISSVGDLTLIDGKRYIFIGCAFKHKITELLKRAFIK